MGERKKIRIYPHLLMLAVVGGMSFGFWYMDGIYSKELLEKKVILYENLTNLNLHVRWQSEDLMHNARNIAYENSQKARIVDSVEIYLKTIEDPLSYFKRLEERVALQFKDTLYKVDLPEKLAFFGSDHLVHEYLIEEIEVCESLKNTSKSALTGLLALLKREFYTAENKTHLLLQTTIDSLQSLEKELPNIHSISLIDALLHIESEKQYYGAIKREVLLFLHKQIQYRGLKYAVASSVPTQAGKKNETMQVYVHLERFDNIEAHIDSFSINGRAAKIDKGVVKYQFVPSEKGAVEGGKTKLNHVKGDNYYAGNDALTYYTVMDSIAH